MKAGLKRFKLARIMVLIWKAFDMFRLARLVQFYLCLSKNLRIERRGEANKPIGAMKIHFLPRIHAH